MSDDSSKVPPHRCLPSRVARPDGVDVWECVVCSRRFGWQRSESLKARFRIAALWLWLCLMLFASFTLAALVYWLLTA